MGGGTKLIRTLLAGETEGAGATDGVRDSCAIGEGVGVGDSCAEAIRTKIAIRSRSAKLTLVVMSSEVETSRTFSENLQRFLDFARNDKD